MSATLCVVSPELERVVARLVCDGAFRAGFFADPASALRDAGLRLAAAERDALAGSPLVILDALEGRSVPAPAANFPDSASTSPSTQGGDLTTNAAGAADPTGAPSRRSEWAKRTPDVRGANGADRPGAGNRSASPNHAFRLPPATHFAHLP